MFEKCLMGRPNLCAMRAEHIPSTNERLIRFPFFFGEKETWSPLRPPPHPIHGRRPSRTRR
jgi:hypothetical protein